MRTVLLRNHFGIPDRHGLALRVATCNYAPESVNLMLPLQGSRTPMEVPMSFSKILLPVDGSEHARLALRHALALAEGGSTVVLVHSYGDIPALIGGEAREQLMKECVTEADALLEPYRTALSGAAVPYVEHVVAGAPVQAILSVCEREACDLIVMGSRGLTDFEGMVMGSVAHGVLHQSTVPVLVAR